MRYCKNFANNIQPKKPESVQPAQQPYNYSAEKAYREKDLQIDLDNILFFKKAVKLSTVCRRFLLVY